MLRADPDPTAKSHPQSHPQSQNTNTLSAKLFCKSLGTAGTRVHARKTYRTGLAKTVVLKQIVLACH